MKSVSVGAGIATLIALVIGAAGAAVATPALCSDARLCGDDLGDVYYCPDTGKVVGAFAPCPSLVTGPYAPGGLRPNQGLSPLG